MGEVKHVLGMLIKRDREKMIINQSKYLEGVWKTMSLYMY